MRVLSRFGVTDHDLGGDELHLLLDMDLAAEEVDVPDPQPEHLALAEPAAGADHAERPVSLREGVDDRLDLLDRPGLHLALLDVRRPTDRALHGFEAISPSSTAALSTVDTLVKMART